jgi:hypothetical protein
MGLFSTTPLPLDVCGADSGANESGCVDFENEEFVIEGSWGCCRCRTFNGPQRSECKFCDHRRCS